jgi:hypothetical protein
MEEPANKSDIARLRQQIAAEYEAAVRGLHGLSQGTAQHAFITQRMERMAACHETLKGLVGEQEASKLLAEALAQAGNGER